jgi:hypothetical protein
MNELHEMIELASLQCEGGDLVNQLRAKLDLPGGKAGVVCRFIGGEYEAAGTDFEAYLLGHGHQKADSASAFEAVTNFLTDLGADGAELAKTLRAKN